MKIEIRNAEKMDSEALKAISRRTISANYRSFLGDRAVDGFLGSGAVDHIIEDSVHQSIVILAEGKAVGFCVYEGDLIELMMIDDEFHRKGLGSQLLAHCEQTLFKTYTSLRLESFEPNKIANNFYKKNGWIESKRYFDADTGVDKILFTKRP